MVSLILHQPQAEQVFENMIERVVKDEGKDVSRSEKEEAKAILTEKARLTSKLVSDRIRRKFHAFRASKHDIIANVKWEVVERKYDKDEGEKARGAVVI